MDLQETPEVNLEVGEIKPGRFVLVGGPGQGKSTVGQFLCQLYRVSLLTDRPPHQLSPEAREALGLFTQQCVSSDLPLPLARRFPVRVVLDQFAASLAHGTTTSLLDYMRQRIEKMAGRLLEPGDLRTWLKHYPWLLVLDGLDEVPATSNRKNVLEAIQNFWSEVGVSDADMLVVATTRPQGYNEEFSPRFFAHRHLTPLSPARALHYARRLVNARYAADLESRERVYQRLQKASENETTARLMRTPLQVTIMAALVERVGQPPHQRWKLFDRYYHVIYQREIERDIPASQVLNDREEDVIAIHQRVGLLLQVKSEYAGGTEALLSKSQFERIIRNLNEEEECPPAQIEAKTHEILDAALNRLVFLVGLREDAIGFEIRSLQEFMAAEAIMHGSDVIIKERLLAIASIPHWRNVFLFAAGKVFAERSHMRDTIISICGSLNEPAERIVEEIPNSEETCQETLAAITLAGSRLALDLLNDELSQESHRYKRQMMRHALQLLEYPDEAANMRLAEAYNLVFDDMFQDTLRTRLSLSSFDERRGAWIVLKILVSKGVDWAEKLAENYYPSKADEQLQILQLGGTFIPESWLPDKLPLCLCAVNFTKASKLLYGLDQRFTFSQQEYAWHTLGKVAVKGPMPKWAQALFNFSEVLVQKLDVRLLNPSANGYISLGICVNYQSATSISALSEVPSIILIGH